MTLLDAVRLDPWIGLALGAAAFTTVCVIGLLCRALWEEYRWRRSVRTIREIHTAWRLAQDRRREERMRGAMPGYGPIRIEQPKIGQTGWDQRRAMIARKEP